MHFWFWNFIRLVNANIQHIYLRAQLSLAFLNQVIICHPHFSSCFNKRKPKHPYTIHWGEIIRISPVISHSSFPLVHFQWARFHENIAENAVKNFPTFSWSKHQDFGLFRQQSASQMKTMTRILYSFVIGISWWIDALPCNPSLLKIYTNIYFPVPWAFPR